MSTPITTIIAKPPRRLLLILLLPEKIANQSPAIHFRAKQANQAIIIFKHFASVSQSHLLTFKYLHKLVNVNKKCICMVQTCVYNINCSPFHDYKALNFGPKQATY